MGAPATNSPEVWEQALRDLLPEGGKLDFLILSLCSDEAASAAVRACLPYLNESALLLMRGIRTCQEQRTWKLLCAIPQTHLTLDLRDVGIALFKAKLHKQHYKL
jgi:hypothetical protein